MATILVPEDQSTIAAALAAASSGDTISIADGTYVENDLARVASNLTIRARNLPTYDADGNAVYHVLVNNVSTNPTFKVYEGWTLWGLEIHGPTTVSYAVEGNGSTNRQYTVLECQVFTAYGGVRHLSDSGVVDRCLFGNIGPASAVNGETHGPTVRSSGFNVVTGNVPVVKSVTGTVDHCLFIDCEGFNYAAQAETVTNTIGYDSTPATGGAVLYGSSALNHNDVQYTGGSDNYTTDGTTTFSSSGTNYDLDPGFVDPMSFLLRLDPASPLIGAGVVTSTVYDYAGDYWDSPPSIGFLAYEAGPPPTPGDGNFGLSNSLSFGRRTFWRRCLPSNQP